jgi:DNA-binding NarL/FixJ family response regulator
VIAIGKTNTEAGLILGISARTVQNHLANAYDKLSLPRLRSGEPVPHRHSAKALSLCQCGPRR